MRPLPALLPLLLAATLVAQDKPPVAPPPAARFTLTGHADPVYSVAFSGDGKRIATGSFDKSVKLWDAVTGKELRTFAGKAGHTNLVTAVTFSPDGSSVASAGTDNFARVWDVPTGKPQLETDLTAGGVKVAVSPDGKLYAAGAADGTVKVFTAADNKLSLTVAANTGAVLGLGFNASGQTLYTLAADKVLRYWNTADGKLLAAVGATTGTVTAFAVNPASGQPIVVTADGVAAFFPATAPVLPKALPALGEAATALALSGDGVLTVVATADKKLKAFRTAEATPLFDIALPAVATKVSVNANGTQILAVAGNQLHLLGADGKPRAVLPTEPLLDVAFVSNQPQFVTLATSGIARTFTVPAAPLAVKPLVHPDVVNQFTLTADGKKVITAGNDKVVRVWTAGAVEREFMGHTAAVVAVGVATDNVVSADADGGVLFWTPADGKQVAKLAGPKKAVVSLAVLPNTKTVAVGYADEVRVFATPTTAEKDVKAFPHPKPVRAVAWAADNKKVISFCADGKVRVLNPESGKEEASFDLTAKDKTTAVAVSTDRTKFAELGGGNLAVRPLAADGKPAFSVPAGEGSAVTWSGDGKLIAVGAKGAVKVFDASTGAELQTVAEPTGGVKGLAFLPDNKTLLTADDKQVSAAELWVSGTRATAAKPSLGVLSASATSAVLGTADKTVRLFEAAPAPAAKEVKAFPGLPADAKHATLSKDGQLIAAVSGKVVKAWTTADGKETSLAPLPADGTLVAMNADRSKLAVALADDTAVVIHVASGRVEQVVRHAGAVVGLAFHPSQPILYTASADKTVQATTLATPRLAADSGRFGVAFAVTSNGASTVSAGNGKGLAIANSTTSAAERVVSDLTGVTAIAVNKANTQLAAYTPANQTVSLFNAADGTLIGSWKAPAAVLELSSHPTLPSLVGVLADNRVVAWNTLTEAGQPLPVEFGKVGMELPHPAAVKGVAVVGDSLLSVADDKKLRAWKFVADAPSRTYQHPSGVNAVAFDKTGTRLATGGQDGVLRIWDATKKDGAAKAINAHVPAQPAPPRAIYAVAWTPDAKQVVTGSDDQSIKIWDAAAGTLVREIKPGKDAPPTPEAVKAAAPAVLGTAQVPSLNLPPPPGHTDQVYALAVSPDGQFLVSGSADKTVKLWNLATGELVRAFVSPGLKPDGAAHPGFVQSVRFTPDGTKAVSVGSAPKNMGFVAVWNVADGKRLAAYELPTGPIYSVDVTADGTAVLGCGPKTRGVSESDAVVLPLTK